MKRIFVHLRPSPAMVVACTALLFALTGAGYAAGMLGPNTVGTKQLKSNAVISSKVKNSSLLAVDFKAGQLPQGAKGDKGDQAHPASRATGLPAQSSPGRLRRRWGRSTSALPALPAIPALLAARSRFDGAARTGCLRR